MARYSFERLIDAPAPSCFDLFSDLDQIQRHSSEVVEMKKTNDKPFEPGMTFTCSREMMGKVHTEELEVERVDPGRSYTMGCMTCGSKWLSTYTFEPAGQGTRVRLELTCTPKTLMAWLMSPMVWIFSGMMKKSINKELDELKAACEAGSTAPA